MERCRHVEQAALQNYKSSGFSGDVQHKTVTRDFLRNTVSNSYVHANLLSSLRYFGFMNAAGHLVTSLLFECSMEEGSPI